MLRITGLDVEARVGRDRVRLLDQVDLAVGRGRCTAVIGESGSGKSTLLKSILRTGGRRVSVSGSIVLAGREIGSLGVKEVTRVRGKQVALVAQNALAALDPFYAVGDQIAYLARRHGGLSKADARVKALDLLREVALADPERNMHALPHELSGGMRQRCVLAMALACEPRLLLADEPTTALDVITQARALALLASIQRSHGMSMVFVTHDIGVAATVADDVVVLHRGKVVESGPVATVLLSPSHPYTQGLVAANRPPAPGERWRTVAQPVAPEPPPNNR